MAEPSNKQSPRQDHLDPFLQIVGPHLYWEGDSSPVRLFTHAYGAVGRWQDQAPLFSHLVTPDGRDIFDLASLTKALVTTPLVFHFMGEGRPLDGTVGQWSPELAQKLHPTLASRSIESLLSHTSGLPWWRNFWTMVEGEPINSIKSHLIGRLNLIGSRLEGSDLPKPEQAYSDVGFLLLGLLLESIGRGRLNRIFRDKLSHELQVDLGRLPLGFAGDLHGLKERAIKTSYCPWRRRDLIGEVHDENCAALGGITGHSGLFASGNGLVRYLQALQKSVLGREVFKANRALVQYPIKSPPNESLCGFRQGADPSSVTFGNGRNMGHMGFVGVAFWVTDAGYAVFLTNRVISGRMKPGIRDVRREVFALFDRILVKESY